MLRSENRIGKKEVDMLFKQSRFLNSPNLTFKFIIDKKSPNTRISFVAPKSVAKLAVKRNSLRRRGYTMLKKHLTNFPAGLMGVFLFRKYQDDSNIIENEIKEILNKIN